MVECLSQTQHEHPGYLEVLELAHWRAGIDKEGKISIMTILQSKITGVSG